MTGRRSLFVALGLGACAAALVLIGSFWAFTRGGNDFNVFYEAWRLVLSGWGTEIYKATPDRFLYAPGFAWVLAPLGIFPRDVALAFWCACKAALLALAVRELAARLSDPDPWVNSAVASAGLLAVGRPLLIDFQYGQVNAIILGLAMLALLGHFDRRKPTRWDGVRWFGLALFAVAKLYPLPLLAVPWLATQGVQGRKLRWERMGIASAVVLMVFLPALSLGASAWLDLFSHWREALRDRGLPKDSHNQSFVAFLHHYLSGAATHVLAKGPRSVVLGSAVLGPEAIVRLALAWSLVWGGFLLGWIFSSADRFRPAWLAVMIGLLIVPSHLVWKPYFVMSYPLAAIAIERAWGSRARRGDPWGWGALGTAFAVVNLTGFDLVGEDLGARIEAASLFLFAHLGLLAWVAAAERQAAPA